MKVWVIYRPTSILERAKKGIEDRWEKVVSCPSKEDAVRARTALEKHTFLANLVIQEESYFN